MKLRAFRRRILSFNLSVYWITPIFPYQPGTCHSRWSDENSISFNLSDTCTDSESEFDEQVHSTPYLPTNSSGTYTNDDHISKPNGKALDAPRVTFNQTLYIHSDRSLKSCLQKGSMRREIENGFTQIVRLTKKRNCLREKNDLKNNYSTKFCTSRFPTKCEKQIALKDKMFLEERMKNSRNAQSGKIWRKFNFFSFYIIFVTCLIYSKAYEVFSVVLRGHTIPRISHRTTEVFAKERNWLKIESWRIDVC